MGDGTNGWPIQGRLCIFNYIFHFTYNYLQIDYTYDKYKHAKLRQQLRQVPLNASNQQWRQQQ